MVDDIINKRSKSSDDLENVNDGMQNVETTGSDNIGDGDALKHRDGTLTLRLIEKSNGDMAGEKQGTVNS